MNVRFNQLLEELRNQLKAEKLTSNRLRAEVFDAQQRYSKLESKYLKLLEASMQKAIKAPASSTVSKKKPIKLGDMK